MTALARKLAIPAFPLGRPTDGRERYGMTPEQSRVYRWLVQNRPHGEDFKPRCREIAGNTGLSLHAVHHSLGELADRGWLIGITCQSGAIVTKYRFVQPIMHFRGASHG